MPKIPEKGITYKTARISYISNYFLAALVAVLLILILPYMDVTIFIRTVPQLISYLIFSVFLIIITFLIEQPTIEQWIRKYVITNNEVMKVEGIIRKKHFAIPYQSIADVQIHKGVVGRIFNFGNVEITGMKEPIHMKGIKNPEEVLKIIENKVNLMRNRVIKNKEAAE